MKTLLAAGLGLMAFASLGGTSGYLVLVETATVHVTLPAWKLESSTVVRGSPTGGEFQTHRQQATLTETVTGTATGSVGTPGSYATGTVVVTLSCVPPGPQGCPGATVFPGVKVCRVSNVCYQLMGVDACFCPVSIPILAMYPGAIFNSPAGTVNTPAWSEPAGTTVSVTNPAPITGGSDPTSSPAVTKSDIDAATASVRAQLTTDLQTALQLKAGGQMHVIADGAPKVTVTASAAAGAHTKTFQVSATGTLGATEFLDSDAQALITTGINRWVPAGYRLNGPPVLTDYRIADTNEQGDVTVTGKALDYLVPEFSIDALRSQVRGLNVGAAHTLIQKAIPGSLVDIRLGPAAASILPLNTTRISIVVSVRAAT